MKLSVCRARPLSGGLRAEGAEVVKSSVLLYPGNCHARGHLGANTPYDLLYNHVFFL